MAKYAYSEIIETFLVQKDWKKLLPLLRSAQCNGINIIINKQRVKYSLVLY